MNKDNNIGLDISELRMNKGTPQRSNTMNNTVKATEVVRLNLNVDRLQAINKTLDGLRAFSEDRGEETAWLAVEYALSDIVDSIDEIIKGMRLDIEGINSPLPKRNCDMYVTEAEAWDAFSSARQGVDSSTEEYEQWLFEQVK